VTAGRASEGQPGFRFRRLGKPEELRAAEELQREEGDAEGDGPVAAAVQRDYLDHGGLVLGAFADIYLAGVAIGFLGWDGQRLYHFAHGCWVRPEYRNHHVGFQIAAFLREEVLRQGLPTIRSHLDPLSSRAAHLAVRRLGAHPERYLPHLYGAATSEAHRGVATDRLDLRWELTAPATGSRLAGRTPTEEEDRARWGDSVALLETDLSEEGLRRPTAVVETDRPHAQIEIPFDLAAVEEHAPELERRWRHAVRDAFRAAFDTGYVVDDFAVLRLAHERRSFYLLSAPPPAPPPAGATAAPVAPARGPPPPGDPPDK
jgi:predicted GNAT superfamily acetyltransferase